VIDLRSVAALVRAVIDEATRHFSPGARMPEDVTLRAVDGRKR
jgi:hypothetical protein